MRLPQQCNCFIVSRFVWSLVMFLLLVPQSLHARSVYTTVTGYFLTLDSLFDAMAESVSYYRTLDETNDLFLDQTKSRPEISYIIRINAQAKMVNKITDGAITPAHNRYIGNQDWYKTIMLSKKPYYSIIVNRDMLFLFWAKPVLAKVRNGIRFNGAVAAKINLNECFETISRLYSISFQIINNGDSFFSSINDSATTGQLIEQKLAVYGMRGLIIRYPEAKYVKPSAAGTDNRHTYGSSDVIDNTDKSEKAVASIHAENESVKKQSKAALSIGQKAVFIFGIILCAGILVACFVILKKAAEKREKFLEAFERGEI